MENEAILIDAGGTMPGGLAVFGWWAFAADVASWPSVPATPELYAEAADLEGEFVMKAGKGFHRLESDMEMSELASASQGEMNCLSADGKYTIVQCGTNAQLMGFIQRSKNRKVVVLVPDLEGRVRQLGCEALPAKFVAFSILGGKKTSDLKAIEATVYAPGALPMFYVGEIPIAPETPSNSIIDENSGPIVDESGDYFIYESE
jgi:hypothetical protein